MWFEVDKAGLGKLLERKGKPFILFELIQNCLDEDTKRVDVTLERVPGTRSVRLTVEDDNPTGFADLSHAFTLFAESKKKADATKRGRFNLGEKLVLALCDEAEIRSTKGGYRFDEAGRHTLRSKREAGSVFTGTLKMTNDELAECHAAVHRLLLPASIEVYYNGEKLAPRLPLKSVEATLQTEVANDEGLMVYRQRKTAVEFFEPAPGEEVTLYEMGIPVVATGDRFHCNVQQKVPLNFDRDNVKPAFLAAVRALAVDSMADDLTTEDANATWVKDAMQTHGDELSEDTIDTLMTLRFGDRRVAYDPSDPEANSRATAAGYTVIHGRSLSGAEWDAVKRVGAVLPAGQVTPSPKPFSENGKPMTVIPPADWTPGMKAVAALAERIARRLLNVPLLHVTINNDATAPFSAAYAAGDLTLNAGRLGKHWFDGALGPIVDLLVHEFGHHFEGNHLSEGYYHALTRLGGQLVEIALQDPAFFDLRGSP